MAFLKESCIFLLMPESLYCDYYLIDINDPVALSTESNSLNPNTC